MNRKNGAYKTRAFELDVKASGDAAGTFTGYGSVFGVVDSYKEVVAPGAFKNCLAELEKKGRTLPILWQHRTGEPIGVWTMLKEDTHGLLGEGELWLDDAQYARIAWKGMQSKSITGLSIGYYVLRDSYNEKTRVRTLEEIELVEVSIVTVPANDEARIDAIKSMIAHGTLPDLSDFERFLREAGFSKTQSTVIANHGLKHLLRSDSASDSANSVAALIDQATSFTLPTL
jgi:uncharacterized protein